MRKIKKKVLVLASTFPRWENDTTPPFVYELERRLTDDFDIYVLAPHHKGAKKYEEMNGLKVYRFQYFWPSGLQKLCYEGGIMPNIKKNKLLLFQAFLLVVFEFIAMVKIIRKNHIQLIHAHWAIPQGIIAACANTLLNTSYLITTHGSDIYGLKNKMMMRLKKFALTKANKITVVSNSLKKELTSSFSNLPVDVLSMGVDSDIFKPQIADKSIKENYNVNGPLLLFVGRIAEIKGVSYLIKAMPKIIEKFPSVTLLIVGSGPLLNDLKNLTKQLNIEKNIIFTGALPHKNLPAYYATADIFIGPSITTREGHGEGLGLTFVEASMSGCIPIGTSSGGISDVIEDKKTGFIIKEKDSNAIADTVLNILQNANALNGMKLASREAAIKKFDWNTISERYSTIYASI